MLPEQAFKSLGGRMTLEGGGSSAPQASTATQYNTNIPEYAKPYVTNMLGATQEQLFDMNADKGITGFKPYQPYSPNVNDYFASFSPMQQQAFSNIAGMTTNAGTGNAMNQTQDAYNRSANVGPYNAQNFGNQYGSGPQFQNMGLNYLSTNAPNFGQQSAQNYMSPYVQQAIDPTLRENQRQFDVASTGRQAAATRSGAFGGSRQAIEQSEAQRNLGRLQSDTQAQGMQAAYQNAQQQFNADQARGMQSQLANQGAYGQMQGLGMQQNLSANQQDMQNRQLQAQYGMAGLQAGEASRQFASNYDLQNRQQALAAAGQLGALGQQQHTQQQGINAAQQAAGAQQQALEQSKIAQAVQNYATQQQYPMMQLGLMSNMLRGLPMQSTTTQSYQAAPTAASQLVGSAGALASVYQGMNAAPKKKGGVIRGLAHGGSVNGQGYAVGGEIKQQLSTMSEEQLQQVMRTSASNEIRAMAAEILAGKEMAKRITGQMSSPPGAGQGIAAADTGDMFTGMADGGIIAFGRGDLVVDDVPPLTEEEMAGLPVAKRPNMQPGAGASIEDFAKYLGAIRADAGIGAPRQAEKEMLDKRMAGRGAEESSQNYFKAAEFFAKMANTPGGLLRSATAAGAEVLPEFAKLQAAQRQVRETDAKIQADITEAGRLERVGDFTNAAKLLSEAQTLDANNQRTKDEIEGRLKAANVQNAGQLAAAHVRGGYDIQGQGIAAQSRKTAAEIQAGGPSAEKMDAKVFEDYIKDITAKNDKLPPEQKLSPEQIRVAAYRAFQLDKGGAGDRLNATLAATMGRTYDALLTRSKFKINSLERDITNAATPDIKEAKTKELKDLKAGLLDEARRIAYNEDAPPARARAKPPLESFVRD
jgi:hypothetical protein